MFNVITNEPRYADVTTIIILRRLSTYINLVVLGFSD